MKIAVVLIGHGVPATDCPPHLVGELMSLQWRGEGHGAPAHSGRAAELDATIRHWPRRDGNDPYKAGLERLAAALKPLVPAELFAIGYNEFCWPSTDEAIEQVIRQGATRIFVIPSMVTPGGVHSESDIPRTLETARRKHPGVAMDYVWPFDLTEVAKLLAAHIQQAVESVRQRTVTDGS